MSSSVLILYTLFSNMFTQGYVNQDLFFMNNDGRVATVLAINYVMRKEYPWLYAEKTSTKDLIHRYHGLIVKTKQVFVHKIALFVIEQTAPLIIYAFVSLTMVTFYGNYMILMPTIS